MNLTELTPLELNKYRFSGNHTPLTPDQIESMRNASSSSGDTPRVAEAASTSEN